MRFRRTEHRTCRGGRAFFAPHRLLRQVLCCVAVAVAAAGLVVPVFWPGAPWARGFSTVTPVAQVIAFPVPVGIAAVVLGALLVVAAGLRRGGRLLTLTGAIALLVGALLAAFPAGVVRPTTSTAGKTGAVREVTVVTFNTQSQLAPHDLGRLLDAYDPDVVVLPETSARDAERAANGNGFHGAAFSTPLSGFTDAYHGRVAPTSVLVHARLGPAEAIAGPPTTFGTVTVRFDDPTLPTVMGVHTAPPLPGLVDDWKNDLARVVDATDTHAGALIVAGDFNATLRHGAIARRQHLVDSAQLCDRAPEGTWPNRFPPLLRSQIDHVFISPDLHAQGCEVVDVGTSDHAAYVTTVTGTTSLK